MTIIRIDDKKPSASLVSPREAPSTGTTVIHHAEPVVFNSQKATTTTNPDPNGHWQGAGDVCTAKRAAGGGGYQGDVHHNDNTSASVSASDYACGRGVGKW